MNLLKTSLLSSIASIIKVSFGFILTKLLAVYGGISDVAMLGQVQNIHQMLAGIGSAGIEKGVIKYASEYRGDQEKTQKILATAFRLIALFQAVVIAVVLLFSGDLSAMLFKRGNNILFLVILAVMPTAVLGIMLMAVLNGYHEVRKLVGVIVSSNIIGILIALWLVPIYGLNGAIAVFLLGPVSSFLMSVYMLTKVKGFSFRFFMQKTDPESLRKLGKFTVMTIVTAISLPLALTVIRTYLGEHLSWADAGIWTGLWRISDGYLMLITMTLAVYYLPRLSEIHRQSELNREIIHGQKMILPLVALLALSVYVLREYIIRLLFSKSFDSMEGLFAPQLVGDVIRIAAWLYSYVIFAKADVVAHVSIQVLLTASFLLLAMIMTNTFGLVGVSYAFATNSLIFLVVVFSYYKIQCKKNVFDTPGE